MKNLLSLNQQKGTECPLVRRAFQLVITAMVASALCAVIVRLAGNIVIFNLLMCGLSLLALCLLCAYKQRAELAAQGLIWVLTGIAVAGLWLEQDFLGTSILGLPCILIFAAMLGRRTSFVAILLIFLVNIALLGVVYGDHNGSALLYPAIGTHIRPLLAIIILGVSGFAMHLLIKDYTTTIASLIRENAKVKESQAAITFLANHDALTALPNRNLAQNLFQQAVQRSVRRYDRTKIALMSIDLDDFKAINDSLSHEIGDRYLVAIAQRLRDSTRASDTVCRLGGDEFLVLLEGLDDACDVSSIAQSIQQAIARPMVIGSHKLVCSASIGISVYPNDGLGYDELVKKSDIAMYRSKDMGRNTYHYYCDSMNGDALERMQLLEDLRSALKNNEFFLEYQPIILLASGKITGAEALVRWQHPVRGFIGPDAFISLAEKSGLIVEIGAWVLERACRDIALLQHRYASDFRIAVNVSTVQLKRGDFQDRIQTILNDAHITPSSLELEITESELLSDSPQFDDAMTQLKAMGIGFAIDDFGTGYSNLGYVQKIKVAKLKIDRSFVQGIEANTDNQAIVRAVHNIADGLVMNTVAEGVEHTCELDVLKTLGVTHGQGYLWSRPVPIQSLMSLVGDAA